MRITDLAGKNICILGYGREGKAMVEALEKYAPGCRITIADKNEELRITNYETQLGATYLDNLDRFDVVIKSPGISPKEFSTFHFQLSTSTQICMDSIAGSGATVIGITGSKGKSTTSSLIHHILTQASDLKQHVFLVGNIGNPAIAHLDDAKEGAIFVFEMSSYQLMDLTVSPQIAVVTSFFAEHLDYHGALVPYLEAKKHIARFQKSGDHIYYNAKFSACEEIARESKGNKHPFSDIDAPVLIEETKLKGTHNLSNIAAAFLVAEQLGVPQDIAIDAIKSFTPLKHRLESIGTVDGVEWVNDSISTTPESAIAALDALGEEVKVMILGGQDRGYDFSPLVERLKRSNVETVILLPDSGKTIAALMKKAGLSQSCIEVKTMDEAVRAAKKDITDRLPLIADRSGSIILLSPASPSYGHFKNFEDRGEQFRNAMIG